jgi:hypothetical protein
MKWDFSKCSRGGRPEFDPQQDQELLFSPPPPYRSLEPDTPVFSVYLRLDAEVKVRAT